MIVPRSRLLFWVCLVVLPFSLLGAVEPSAGGISLLAIGALTVLVLMDALRARSSLAGINVALPEVTRMSKDREGRLEMRIRNERQKAGELRVALALPREIESTQEDALVALPAGSEWSRFGWVCRPRKRGSYRAGSAYLEASSPFGFWAARKSVSTRSEVRVYPNLFNERKNLAALFLHRGAFGLHAQRQVGKGREFEKLREYIPGDGFDEIHWKATAKRGYPVTKVFQIERTQEVYVLVDASRLSARVMHSGSQVRSADFAVRGSKFPAPENDSELDRDSEPILERFVSSALILGLVAQRQGDSFGVLSFSDRIHKFIRAKTGKAHYSSCRDALFGLQTRLVTPDFAELVSFIRLRLRRRALLIFLTDLNDPAIAESFSQNLRIISRQHLILVQAFRPPGVDPLFTGEKAETVDSIYERLGGHLQWVKLRELERTLKRLGVGFSLVEQEALSAQLVAQYMRVKQHQLI